MGPSNVGKSCIVNKFVSDNFLEEHLSTIEE